MRTIDDDDRKIHSAMDVVRELSTPPKIIVDTASKLNLTFLIKIPEDTEIYLRDSYKKLLVRRWGDTSKIFDFNRDERTLLITSDVNFLGLEPSEYEPIIPMGHVQVKEFNSIAKISTDFEITILDAASYTSLCSAETFDETYKGTFDSFHKTKSIPLIGPSKPTQEKIITVAFNDLLITSNDLRTIRGELSRKRPAYGKFKTEEWTSTMLAQLNEASTHFFSNKSNNVENLQLHNDIKKWFNCKWADGGKDLLEQAANAILPDDRYPNSPAKTLVNETLRHEYNDYASTSLIIINEAAKKYRKEMEDSKHHTFAKNKTIQDYLKDNWGLSTKLAVATSTIIRPDNNKQKRPYSFEEGLDN